MQCKWRVWAVVLGFGVSSLVVATQQPVIYVENQSTMAVIVAIDNVFPQLCRVTAGDCIVPWSVGANTTLRVKTSRCLLNSHQNFNGKVRGRCQGALQSARISVTVPRGTYAGQYHFFMASGVKPWHCSWLVGVQDTGALHIEGRPKGCVMNRVEVNDLTKKTANTGKRHSAPRATGG